MNWPFRLVMKYHKSTDKNLVLIFAYVIKKWLLKGSQAYKIERILEVREKDECYFCYESFTNQILLLSKLLEH